MKTSLLLAAALLAAPAVRAEEEAKPAEAAAPAQEAKPAEAAAPAKEEKAAEAAPAKADKPAAKAAAAKDDRAYVDTALAFLKAYAHSARKGDQGEQAWNALKEHAAEKVSVKIGGKEHTLDVAGKKSEARLTKFAKISTWREGEHIRGVNVDVLEFKVGKDEHKTKGRVSLSEKDGKWLVDAIEAD
jgi:hypothetical protein